MNPNLWKSLNSRTYANLSIFTKTEGISIKLLKMSYSIPESMSLSWSSNTAFLEMSAFWDKSYWMVLYLQRVSVKLKSY